MKEMEDMMCCICFELIENNMRVIELKCEHLYHEKCAIAWVGEN